ncbi:MAG: DUF3141 domain-containing protein [Candidatus Moranbacteria bacterium]|nr:DUF3141 domain-containing protein [Candidatus Moranbacteria bacterium]
MNFEIAAKFLDLLVRRGDERKKQPPNVLCYPYETIMDKTEGPAPANHKLVRLKTNTKPEKQRPLIIVDPRAGRRSGVSCVMETSQASTGAELGYPVYYVIFDPEPEKGQTIPCVLEAIGEFIEKTGEIHQCQESGGPIVVGNCAAGWAIFLAGLLRPEIKFTCIPIGAPLSFWSGLDTRKSMRYLGALTGGYWIASLLADMNGGKFDGKNLAQNFQIHDLEHSFFGKWQKTISGLKDGDDGEKFLRMERWWNLGTRFNKEEINWIARNLFTENQLEEGRLSINGKQLNMEEFHNELVIFASFGDTIVSPQQALMWIPRIYSSKKEIQHKIVYNLHPNAGHMSIFLSEKLARQHFRRIIQACEQIPQLENGLYKLDNDDFQIKESGVDDVLSLGGYVSPHQRKKFYAMARIARFNNEVYENFFGSWVRATAGQKGMGLLNKNHPFQASVEFFSSVNPFVNWWMTIAQSWSKSLPGISFDNAYSQLGWQAWSSWLKSVEIFNQGMQKTAFDVLAFWGSIFFSEETEEKEVPCIR